MLTKLVAVVAASPELQILTSLVKPPLCIIQLVQPAL
jgi:hypothetical protein